MLLLSAKWTQNFAYMRWKLNSTQNSVFNYNTQLVYFVSITIIYVVWNTVKDLNYKSQNYEILSRLKLKALRVGVFHVLEFCIKTKQCESFLSVMFQKLEREKTLSLNYLSFDMELKQSALTIRPRKNISTWNNAKCIEAYFCLL